MIEIPIIHIYGICLLVLVGMTIAWYIGYKDGWKTRIRWEKDNDKY